jgi:DNA-binding transcriptional MerR regulator
VKSSALTIGQLANDADTKVVTIRYYEKVGIMPAPSRTAGNYRAYDESHLARLLFIRRCRELGFTLDQIGELLGLSEQGDHDCCEVDSIAQGQLRKIEKKIADLNSLAAELRRLIEQCEGGRIENCRILESLAGQ